MTRQFAPTSGDLACLREAYVGHTNDFSPTEPGFRTRTAPAEGYTASTGCPGVETCKAIGELGLSVSGRGKMHPLPLGCALSCAVPAERSVK